MPKPVFVALLLADRVITEDNQKKAIIGTLRIAMSTPISLRAYMREKLSKGQGNLSTLGTK